MVEWYRSVQTSGLWCNKENTPTKTDLVARISRIGECNGMPVSAGLNGGLGRHWRIPSNEGKKMHAEPGGNLQDPLAYLTPRARQSFTKTDKSCWHQTVLQQKGYDYRSFFLFPLRCVVTKSDGFDSIIYKSSLWSQKPYTGPFSSSAWRILEGNERRKIQNTCRELGTVNHCVAQL